MSTNNQEGKSFRSPAHLFNGPAGLSEYPEANYPADMKAVPVTAENIEMMETAAGFLMPEDYLDHLNIFGCYRFEL